MVSRHRHAIVCAVLLAGLTLAAGAPGAQSKKQPPLRSNEADLTALIERMQMTDKEAEEDGFLLQQFHGTTQSKTPGSQTMKLSLGEVGDRRETSPFDNDPDPRFALDPLADPDPMPGVGLNLKMKF